MRKGSGLRLGKGSGFYGLGVYSLELKIHGCGTVISHHEAPARLL